MSYHWTVYASLFIGINAALAGGVFQSFSDFVMRGLMQGSPASGIQSMQGINRTVLRSLFLNSFFLLVPATLAMTYIALTQLDGTAQKFIVFGTVAYIGLVFIVTVIGNVPMNERLAKLAASSIEATDYWQTYGRDWTRLNHIRTIGSVVTAISYLFAMLTLTKT
ncbi:MAG: anthrone oxygenase family protein [Pseudomonadota bacterium]